MLLVNTGEAFSSKDILLLKYITAPPKLAVLLENNGEEFPSKDV